MKASVMVLAALLGVASASAEFFADVFGDRVSAQSGEFHAIEDRDASVPAGVLTAQGDLDGSNGAGIGIRGGYWLNDRFRWLGTALDFNYFKVDAEDSDAEVSFSAFSLMLLCRYPLLISENHPDGQIYPYAGIGISRADVRISTPSNLVSGDVQSDVGGVFCAGMKWMAMSHFGFFVEYRIVSISFDDRESSNNADIFGNPHPRVFEAEGDVEAHQFLGGIAFHF